MAKNKRDIWRGWVERGRRFLDKMDDALLPKSKQLRQPARVPIPVRNNSRQSLPNPYERN